MADGGMFPWKVQKLVSRGPVADYSGLRNPLPSPPTGMRWSQHPETREWKLVPADSPDDFGDDTAADSSYNNTNNNNEEDWELLSDKKAGSVRSLSSMESFSHASNSSHNNLSVPFKIARTHSSSTIDSSDNNNNNALGPSGKGVLGVDYVEHVVLPSDTLQGICLAYKINSQRLKQANHFSGGTLLLAPKRLVIPISKKALRSGFIRVQDTDAKEYKVHAFLAEFPDLSVTEARACVPFVHSLSIPSIILVSHSLNNHLHRLVVHVQVLGAGRL
jgi:LysM repeat protein